MALNDRIISEKRIQKMWTQAVEFFFDVIHNARMEKLTKTTKILWLISLLSRIQKEDADQMVLRSIVTVDHC